MKKSILLCIVCSLVVSLPGLAQNRYALLVGINEWMKINPSKTGIYSRPKDIPELSGCLNDVNTVSDILKARFGFQDKNIFTLKNKQATRDEILKSLDAAKARCHKGDVFFFYFSGHGSQIYNEASPELDKMDETICPYDAILKNKDIRDKQIAMILQDFLDKGVIVTAMFESCHSGSIARGLDIEEEMASASNDIINDDKVYPQPGKNGALIIGAAQEFQTARCKHFDNKIWQGCFTKAFMEVMARSKADTKVDDLYAAICGYLKNSGDPQIPSIDGNNQRRNASLLGSASVISGPHVAVEKKNVDNTVIVQGGVALGLEEGTELTSEDKKIKLEVTNADLSKSSAKIISGSAASIKPGMLFGISRYKCNISSGLQLCIPAARQNKDELEKLATDVAKIAATKNIRVTDDYLAGADYMLYCNNGAWKLNCAGTPRELGEVPDMNKLAAMMDNGKTLKVLWPVYAELTAKIQQQLADQYATVHPCTYGASDYFVCGKTADSNFEYFLSKTTVDTAVTTAFPLKSDAYNAGDENKAATAICTAAWKLSKIKSWLALDNKNAGNSFSYQLWLKNNHKPGNLQDATVMDGEQYTAKLLRKHGDTSTKKSWIYLFDISSDGSITLLYPPGRQNSDNYLPANPEDSEITLLERIDIGPPFGTDNLIMLATTEPITNPARIEQDGVATRSVDGNDIDRLIDNVNMRTRSVNSVSTTGAWSLQKITLHIVNK